MKKLLFIVPVALIVLTSYNYLKPVTKINIQPLGAVSPVYINQIKKSVKSFYGFDCVVLPSKSISKDIISKIKKRIDADRALSKYNSDKNLLLVTEKDICHFVDKNSPEYGIFGLGGIKKNNNTCIVSTFRLKKRGASQQKILERLEKVALHEIGHNLGLNHCTNNKECMMSAAKGTIKQVDKERVWFCEKCREQLN